MKNLLFDLLRWRQRFQDKPLAIFLNYDGTLLAVAPAPAPVMLPYVTQEILKALVQLKNVKVVIISGWPLSKLKKMAPVKGLAYVASHGMELHAEGLVPGRIVMDKGGAVERLLKFWGKGKFFPIYIGDDRTDEEVFDILRRHGLTVRVGDRARRSKAEYYVKGIDDVRMLLDVILFFRS